MLIANDSWVDQFRPYSFLFNQAELSLTTLHVTLVLSQRKLKILSEEI